MFQTLLISKTFLCIRVAQAKCTETAECTTGAEDRRSKTHRGDQKGAVVKKPSKGKLLQITQK